MIDAALPNNQDWRVWTRWYRYILDGVPQDEAYDLTFAGWDGNRFIDIWEGGPAIANKWIRERLESLGWEDKPQGSNETRVEFATIKKLLSQDPHGATVEVLDGMVRFAPSGNVDDAAIARDKHTVQQHERARARASVARDRVARLANQRGFENIALTIDELFRYLADDTQSVADNISTVWELSTAVGTFIERDDETKAGRGGMTPQMDADARETLDQLVIALAPFVRRFPTARQNDEEVREFRQTRDSIGTPKRILTAANAKHLIEAQSNTVIIVATSAAERSDGVQAEKSRSWLGKTARNVVIAMMLSTGVVGSLAMKYGEKVVEEFYDHSKSREIIQNFLREKESDLIELFSDFPSDLKSALREILRRLKEGKGTPPGRDPTQHA